MKTITEIKYEIDRQRDIRKLNEINSIISWLEEVVIPANIGLNQNVCLIYESDREIGKHFNKIKLILERAKYKIERHSIEYTDNKFLWFKQNKHITNYIKITWE